MYFKIFSLGSGLNNQIKQAGFKANTLEEVSSYVVVSGQLEQSTDKILVPKDYQYDGSVWCEVELISCYERCFCLMRQPEMDFNQLWKLYITTSDDDDQTGSLSLILRKYNKELLYTINELMQNTQNYSKQVRKKLLNISKMLKSIDNSLYTKQIQDILKKII